MPNLAANHPQIVHFAVALLIVGVVLRILSLAGRPKFASPAATLLIVLGTGAAVAAVQSGMDAHGPVERIPGLRALVQEHEEHGEQARNVFLAMVAVEILALGLATRPSTVRFVRAAHAVSALVGVFGMSALYEASEQGGRMVYSYAGGPGLRTGDSADVARLLTAGLFNQARADREAGRPADAARLFAQLAERLPADTTVQLLYAESLLLDSRDYEAAAVRARSVRVDPGDGRLRTWQATIAAGAYLALGMNDSVRAVVTPVMTAFPGSARLQAKLDSAR